MAEPAYDSITEVQRLRDAGIPQPHAEAITLTVRNALVGEVATKSDLQLAQEKLGGEIRLVQKDVKTLGTKVDAEITLVRKDIAALDTKIDTGLAALDTKIDLVKEGLETKMEKQTAQLGEQIANGFADVAERQVVQMRWMIASIIGSIGVLVAAYAAFQ